MNNKINVVDSWPYQIAVRNIDLLTHIFGLRIRYFNFNFLIIFFQLARYVLNEEKLHLTDKDIEYKTQTGVPHLE
jgi:hypothetical protein